MPDELLRIADGQLEVELLPAVGGRLHRLRAFGHDVLRTPADIRAHRATPVTWGAYPMAPWCNRLSTAPTPVADRVVRLPASHVDGSALHGQLASIAWTVADDGSLSVRGGGDGWPWRYEVVERVTILGTAVRIELALTNLDDGPMPAGLGIHPWFVRPLDVRLAGAQVVPSNKDPAAGLVDVAGDLDLRRLGPVPDGLDGTWTDLDDPAVELRWPGLGLAAEIRLHADAGRCVALASPEDIDAVAIEPETHLPQGLRRLLAGEPGGLHLLAPGATLRLTTEWRFSR